MLDRFRQKRRVHTALHQVFHADGFRPGQEEAVLALLSGRDVMGLFPTGAGKSLCYQLPALLLPGPALVISPLIALMRDQVRSLSALGISAVCLDSMQTVTEQQETLRRITAGEVKLIYVSPERLQSQQFLRAILAHTPDMVVVDEAHCVVSWGKAFRPAYAQIGAFLAQLSASPVLCAMTATADRTMQREIMVSLGMRRVRRIAVPMLRPNLIYHAVYTMFPSQACLNLCTIAGKGLIFCRTRRRTEQLAAYLCGKGVNAAFYHAGMPKEERQALQVRFERGEIRVLASTSAFGMGVDIPDVRFVVLDHLPDSVIDLIQQTGRAGRDGAQADAYLLIDPLDVIYRHHAIRRARNQAEHGDRSALPQAKETWLGLRQVLRVCLGKRCIAASLAGALGQSVRPCGVCDACMRTKRLGHPSPLAKVPDLWAASPDKTETWALAWEQKRIMAEFGVPAAGMTAGDLNRAVKTGQVRCKGAWRGVPQQRLQAVLDHIRRAKGYT